ncbi:MAG: alpha/beta fold hydrolase [Candidatus Gracilibacteria bacterium]
MKPEKFTLHTTDSVNIAASFYNPQNATRAVLLLHMMPATKESFEPLARAIAAAGIASLAIDLRGHGGSTEKQKVGKTSGEKLDYKKFTDADHQTSRLDVDAAINFLKKREFEEKNISFVGASIGANLALESLMRYGETSHAVLLSPGLDYHSIKTELPIKELSPTQKVWLVAAKGDAYSADSCTKLHEINSKNSQLTIFEGEGHGTNLFHSQPELVQNIVNFLTQ